MRAFVGVYLIPYTCLSSVSKITGGIGTLCFRLNSFPYNSIRTIGCNV
jgi:hypothetical protein